MKKTLLILLLVVAIVAIHMFLSGFARVMDEGGMRIGLLISISDFAKGDERRLPYSWQEFSMWAKQRGDSRWKPEYLESRFQLVWGLRVAEIDNYKIILIAVDPDIKPSEATLNERLRSFLDPIKEQEGNNRGQGNSAD